MAARKKLRIIHSEPVWANRSYRFQICNWVDQDGIMLFQERTHFPHNWYKETASNYWVVDSVYTDHTLAVDEGSKFGFTPMLELYCDDDNPSWFPSFADFDKCVEYLRAKGERIKVL